MWDIKLTITNEQRQKKKQKFIDKDNSMVGKGGGKEVIKDKGGQMYGDRRRFYFGW